MLPFFQAVLEEFSHILPDVQTLARSLVRMLMAVLLVAIIGYDRERGNKTAGLRTHMMVALGAALFVFVLEGPNGNSHDDASSRIIQGIAAGVGFIGGGAILKLESENRIRGLTTAASIWLAAAIGVACGMGKLNAAIVGISFAWIILAILGRLQIESKTSPVVLPSGELSRRETGDDSRDE